jgi:hypothetical protein
MHEFYGVAPVNQWTPDYVDSNGFIRWEQKARFRLFGERNQGRNLINPIRPIFLRQDSV